MKNRIFFFLFLLFMSGQQHYLVAHPTILTVNNEKEQPIPTPKHKGEKEEKNCPKLTGRVLYPKEAGYDQARLVSNFYSSKNQFPDVIVYCQNTQDVQNAVKWARCQNKPIRIRSGGHNHEGFSTGTGAIVIDVSEMKQLQVDKAKNIATIQPGITGGELYSRLFKEGLTQVGGTCADVGISGLVLTGGMGPLLRKHGLTCDNLLSFEMVNADGEIIQVNPNNEHKDLFWAACGGGAGNFGILTSLTMKLYPASQVTWFNIGWDWNQPVEKVMSVWQDLFADGDKKWFSHLDIWPKMFSIEEYKKQPVKAMGVFYGTPEEAKQTLAPLLNIGQPNDQTIELVEWNQAIKAFEDATSVYITEKPEYKSSGAFAMKPLPPEAIKIIVDTLQKTTSPLLNVLFFSLGGAVQDKSPTATAYFYREAKFFLVYSSQWLQEKDDAKQIEELDALRDRLLPYTQGDYTGNPDRNLKDYLTSYYGENVKRLRCIKRKYDPNNVFQFEQSIPPAHKNEDCADDKPRAR